MPLLDLSVLADLKHLLLEAGQQLPLFLKELAGGEEEMEANTKADSDQGCSYCSGLGHRITNCPKLESIRTKVSFLGQRSAFSSRAVLIHFVPYRVRNGPGRA